MSRQEEKSLEYQNTNPNASPYDAFLAGYNHAIDKACEWLQCLEHELGYMCTGDFINSFRKAMEE